MPSRRLPFALLVVAPLLLAVVAYARVLPGDLVFDDVRAVQKNQALADPGAVLLRWPGALLRGGRPTTDLTFAVDRALGGGSPRTFHVTSLLSHLGVVLLVLVFTRKVLRLAGRVETDLPAAIAAGLFALHPLQSEAVSYVSQRSEVLASGLYVLTLLALLRADRLGPGPRGALAGLGALLAFAVGMGAKSIVVTAPLAWLLLVATVPPALPPGGMRRWRWRLVLLVPLILGALVLARGALRSVEGRPDAGFSVPRSDPGSYFLSQWRALATYLRLLAWPSGQSADWTFPLSRSVGEPAVLACGALLGAILAGAALLWWRSRRGSDPASASGRAAAYGLAWFFLVLAPTSSFLPIADVLVEHRVYLAAWGPFLAVTLGGEALLARISPRRRALVAAAVVGAAWLALAVALYQRNAVWESDLALWRDAVAKAPGKARPRLGLGVALVSRGDAAGAEAEFRAGLARAAEDAPGLRAALQHNLAGALVRLGRPAEAVEWVRRAAAIDPSDLTVRQGLAVALWSAGRLDEAALEAEAVLARDPGSAAAARVLGQVRVSRGDDAGALPLLEQAVRARPSDAAARYDLGAAYANLGRVPEACASWKAVLRLPPDARAQEAARKGLSILRCPP